MNIALILVLIAISAIVFLIRAGRSYASSSKVLESPAEHLRAVDIEAFRNLTDPGEEAFLRTHLAPAEFRRVQRERLGAAVEYVSCAARNAAVLMRLADAGRHSADAATAEAAQKLVDNAIRLRLYALHAIPRLYLGMLLPGARISPGRIAERYEQMSRLVVLLGCLQYPTRGVSAAL